MPALPDYFATATVMTSTTAIASLLNDKRMIVKDNEPAAPPQLVRRAPWHELDHAQRIHNFRVHLGSG